MQSKKKIFSESAKFYDNFYKKKNYHKEFKYINQFLPKKELEIFEVGCGTGSYSIFFAKKNKHVYAIDLSDQMILFAKKKIKSKKINNIEFKQLDILKYKSKKRHDACLMMFNVINYFTTEKDLKLLFRIIYRSLKSGGIFLFDQWKFSNINKSNFQKRKIKINRTQITRNGYTRVDKLNRKLLVNYEYEIKKPFKSKVRKFSESHNLKVHNLNDIKSIIRNKFKIVKYLKWMSVKKKPKKNDNQSFMVLQKI